MDTVYGWTNKQKDRQTEKTDGYIDRWMCGRTNEQKDRQQTDRKTDRWMQCLDGRTNKRMDGWMNGWTNR